MPASLEPLILFYRLGVALVLGLLIGLQREYAWHQESSPERPELFAGARTFALTGLLGATGALMAEVFNAAWLLGVLFVLVGALVTGAYLALARKASYGLTSEVALLLTLGAGALCYAGYVRTAAAVGVTTTVVLALKGPTQSFVARLTRQDVYATLTFAVITVIVLPLLPRTPLGPAPFDVLVPYHLWLMVVLISGISFLGYVLMQVVGTARGTGLAGLLGGLVSSTAVTLSFAQRSRHTEATAPLALGILLAWAVMFARVLMAVAVVHPALLHPLWPPLTVAGLVCLAGGGWRWRQDRATPSDGTAGALTNPFELRPALTFGLLYAAILLGANLARLTLGEAGLYLSGLVAGLADVDAITLSMAALSRDGLATSFAARTIVLATAANTLVKGGIVLMAGSPALRKHLWPVLVLVLATAPGLAFLLR
jgi:uncharacterized membrane protein (DUF4010 family)